MYSKLCSIKIESNFPPFQEFSLLGVSTRIIDYSDDLPKSAPILPAKCRILPPGNVLAAQTDSADRSIPKLSSPTGAEPG